MADHAREGIWNELRLIARRGEQVWQLTLRRDKFALGGAALLMAVTSAANTAMPLFLGNLVDGVPRGLQEKLSPSAIYGAAAPWLGLIGVAYVLREVFGVLRRYLVENTCARVDRDLMLRLVSHLLELDLSTLTRERVGALHGRLSRSVEGFVRFLRLTFLDFFPAAMGGCFALFATMTKQPGLGLVMLGVIPASIGLTFWQIVSQKSARLQLLRSREEMDGMVVEQLGGLDYVRAANTQRIEARRVSRAAEKRRRRELRHHLQMSLFGAGKSLNEGLFHIFVLALAIYLAIHGRISVGGILTFSMLFLNVMTPLAEIHRLIDEGHECSLRIGDLIELLDEPVDQSFSSERVCEPDLNCRGPLIRIDGLHADYSLANGQRRRALDGIDLTVRRGETIGVAGPSGCGKTTMLKVLMRLTHPAGGRVFLGGVPLEEVSRDAIARLIGYVGQSPFLFAGTIAENIGYGVQNATDADLRWAAEMAGIHDEIVATPGGYDAPLTEHGRNLSGGQRQRLALARVFLKNPPVLMLDEATSALDNIRERHVQSALALARQERTVIVVAHRLSTLLDTDRILVFDKGRIVENGTYDHLVNAGGKFAELVRCAQQVGPTHGVGFATGAASRHIAAAGGPRAFRHTRPLYDDNLRRSWRGS